MKGKIKELRVQRARIFEQMKAISEKAEAEARDLTAEEAQQYDDLAKALDALTKRVERLEEEAGIESPVATDEEPRGILEDWPRRARGPADGTGALAPEQRVASWAARNADTNGSSFTPADASEFCLGNIMRALVDPKFRSELTAVETRALAEGVDATGGFITPEVLSVDFIDKVRNAGRVFEAGATTVPLDSDKHSIPRLAGDPTFTWRNENAAFSESQPAFERVVFTPQSGGFIVKTSEELYQDMVPGGGQMIENAIVQTAALELDRAALRGSGTTPEPRGVRNQAGVTIQSLGVNGATPTNANLMAAITTLLGANREPNALVMAPRTSQFYAGLTDTTGQPLAPPQPVADLDRYVTGQVPVNLTQGTSSDTSEIYVGQWADLLVGIRLGVQLRLLTERYADSGQFAWRVFLRADVQLAHPESFVVVTGVRP